MKYVKNINEFFSYKHEILAKDACEKGDIKMLIKLSQDGYIFTDVNIETCIDNDQVKALGFLSGMDYIQESLSNNSILLKKIFNEHGLDMVKSIEPVLRTMSKKSIVDTITHFYGIMEGVFNYLETTFNICKIVNYNTFQHVCKVGNVALATFLANSPVVLSNTGGYKEQLLLDVVHIAKPNQKI